MLLKMLSRAGLTLAGLACSAVALAMPGGAVSANKPAAAVVAAAPRAHAAVRPHPVRFTHRQVVLRRAAEQRHWIARETRRGELSKTQALALRHDVARVVTADRVALGRGHSGAVEALAVSHRQDILDWEIRTQHVEPGLA